MFLNLCDKRDCFEKYGEATIKGQTIYCMTVLQQVINYMFSKKQQKQLNYISSLNVIK